MTAEELEWAFAPVFDEIAERSRVTERFLDRDRYRLYVASLWANVVLNPHDAGLEVGDLEALHDVANARIARDLGPDADITGCFRFVSSRAGDAAMAESRLAPAHRDLLTYFASMILDPEGHKRWMERLRESRGER